MKKKEIIDLGITQFELFRLNYYAAVGSGEQEAIHQMRVALKKFYALKKYLLQGMKPMGAAVIKNDLEPLRMVYRAAGKVRDMQVVRAEIVATPDIPTPEVFCNYLQSKEAGRFEKFLAISNAVNLPTQRDITQLLHEHVNRNSPRQKNHLEHLIGSHLNEARFYLESTQPDELWHEARTLIKQNYLLMQLALEHQPYRFSQDMIQEYRDMEQMLGKWHDYTVLKKYALRFESTRALNINEYVHLIDQRIGNMVLTIREAIAGFVG